MKRATTGGVATSLHLCHPEGSWAGGHDGHLLHQRQLAIVGATAVALAATAPHSWPARDSYLLQGLASELWGVLSVDF